MNVRNIVEKYVGTPHHIEQGEQNMHFCPLCHWKNPRLSVNYNKNAFKCWKCGWSGYSVTKILYDLDASQNDISTVRELLGESEKRKRYDVDKSKLYSEVYNNLFKQEKKKYVHINTEHWVPVLEFNSFLKNYVLNYLHGRQVSNFEIEYYNLHINTSNNLLVIPSYDFNNQLNYYVEHEAKKGGMYINASGISKQENIFFESLIDFRQPIVITEGIFDAIRIGYNTIPILGTFVSKKLISYIKKFNTPLVIFYFDNDAYKSMIKVVEYLLKQGIKCTFVTSSEKDAGVTEREKIKHLLTNSKPLGKMELTKYKLLSA